MKPLFNLVKNEITKAAETCYKSPADFWQKAAILTISTYHLCQVAIVSMNQDTPIKEKAFLIPQEVADGVINLATFMVFAEGFKKAGRALVNSNIVKPFKKESKVFSEEFATSTNLIGSILAVNIVSPIIRNKVGATIQKKLYPKQNIIPNSQRRKTFNELKQNTTYASFTSRMRV